MAWAWAQAQDVVTPNFMINSLKIQNGNVIVTWQGGGTSNQLQRATSAAGPWQNLGSPTSGSSATNPLAGPIGFFRLKVVTNFLPMVNLTSPSGGSSLTGMVSLAASATNRPGGSSVVRVEFYCDSVTSPLGVSTNSPYTTTCDTKTMTNGSHSFYARAYDGAGNWTNSANVSVTVSNNTAPPGQFQWAQFGACGLLSAVTPASVACDRSNNIVAVGAFQSTVDFGSGTLSSAGGVDGFIVKYGPQGTLLWAKRFGGVSDDSAHSVTIDSAGNIIVVGYFSGTVDFGGTILTSVPNPVLGQYVADAFIAKYSPSGSLIWAKGFGGSSADSGIAVTVDGSDNVFMAVTLQSANAVFGTSTFSTAGGDDIVLLKLSAQGAVTWAKRLGGANADDARAITVDRSGDLLVTGNFTTSTDLGGGTINASGTTIFVAKYSGTDGSYKWAKAVGAGSGNGIATDPNTGNVIFTGTLANPTDFGGGPTPTGGIFLASYDSLGNYRWAETFNGQVIPPASGDAGNAVTVDRNGNIALTGTANSTTSIGSGGYFVASFTSTGSVRWTRGAGGSGTRAGCWVGIDSLGQVATAGTWTSAIDFGGGYSSSTTSLYYAPFVAHYGP
jgi:hypothetical protein